MGAASGGACGGENPAAIDGEPEASLASEFECNNWSEAVLQCPPC
jgi:hypothetical protein